MNIALTDIERLTGPYHFLRPIFEQLALSIARVNDREHNSTGTHAAVTATSLVVSGATEINLDAPWAIHSTAILSPAQLTAGVDNYNPTGLADALILRLSSDASRAIGGINSAVGAPGSHWVRKLLVNVGSNDIVLTRSAGSGSNAANQFATPGALDFTLNQNDGVWIHYDRTSTIWRVEGF